MALSTHAAGSLPELVDVALGIRSTLAANDFLWFRGITCSGHSLLPKIMRDGKSEKEIFEREGRLLTRFRQRGLAYWPAGYPQNDWEQLFAMQHYGLPTRLLDWSENIFVAAYFALHTTPGHDHEGKPCTPVIWCIDPVLWNRNMPGPSEYGTEIHVLTTTEDHLLPYEPMTKRPRSKSPLAIFGTHNSERIVAQRGTFVVWGNVPDPLDDFAKAPGTVLLWKIALTGPRDQLYRDLQALGFGETMVFPELSYLAAELTRTEGWRA